MGKMRFVWLSAMFLMAASTAASAQSDRFLDTSLTPEVRAADLVSRMTLEEKASQMVNQSRAIPRLNIPAYNWWNEALHGVNTGGITEFPEPIGLAATFDPETIHEMANVIGVEARIKHARAVRDGHSNMLEGLDFWAPNVNIFRDPRWGRGQETYGEDPFLSARMGVAFVRGLQGDDPGYYLAIATPKHFAVHSGPEPSRHRDDVTVSKHDEVDTYLPAFRAAITEGKAGSIMCAYNSINGEPACANHFLLQDQLRMEWSFRGYVVSDCDAVEDIANNHHFVKSLPEAAAVAVQHGMDNACNTYQKAAGDHDYREFYEAVQQGLLKESDLDRALTRLFSARIRMGMFDPAEMDPYTKIDERLLDSPANRALARRIANESMVLLKNDGVLPIAGTGKKILVVGPLAEQTKFLLGNYNGHPSRSVSILDGLYAEYGKQNVSFVAGTTFLEHRTETVPATVLRSRGASGVHVTYQYEYDSAPAPAGAGSGSRRAGLKSVSGGSVDSVSFEKLPARKPPTSGRLVSVRWNGTIDVAETGDYYLGIKSMGAGSVRIGGKYLAGTPGWDPTQERLGRQHLEAGKAVDFEVEYTVPSTGMKHADFVWIKPEDAQRRSRALESAKQADVVIAVLGITSELEGEEMPVSEPGFMGGDRTSIDMPQPERELLEALGTSGKPVVLVLANGSALAINKESKLANAVLESFYAGEEGGAAVAETISGRNNPAGRLPVTFYASLDQLPPFNDYSMDHRTYRYFTGKPLYAFGFGLSYTTFTYAGLKLRQDAIQAGDSLTAEVSVTNTGQVAGDEVAQLYLKFPPVDGAPRVALRGFQRVHLAAGETRTLILTLRPRDLSMVSAAGDPIIAAGQYRLFVGGAQPDDAQAGVQTDFHIKGTRKIEE